MSRTKRCRVGLVLTFMTLFLGRVAPIAAEETFSAATIDEQGVRLHTVASRFQDVRTNVRVLLPEELKPNERLPVLYVLPVEAGEGRRWGDSLQEVLKHDLQNQHRLICVFPTFSALPWYADHPSDPKLRQESYLLQEILPFIERTYPAIGESSGRWLVGFSKSGYGAYSLLLRHPEVFAKAAAWDAPLMTEQPNKYGMELIFGRRENFEKYKIPNLLQKRAATLGPSTRLILTGYGGFRREHQAAHALMEELKIRHIFRDGPERKHAWNSGWLPEAVGLLAEAE